MEKNVAIFRSSYFSAMFIIFVGISIVMILGICLTTCALYDIEPGKDSLVYKAPAPRTKVIN